MVSQDVHEVRQLVNSLEAATKKQGGKKSFSCKKSSFIVSASKGNVTVDSWRLNDWDYKRPDLPTHARGLFTMIRDNTPEIVVRGYDKFFNVDEVNETQWRNIEINTRGPYELSVKENGCIIFISGLEDGTLLVCSKHSTGARQDTPLSHAQAGEQWVARHLSSVGRSIKDLAKELHKMNVTVVGELCDDRFEEHVLAYDEEASGIYLHGINFNLPGFATLPSSEVHQFADAWGFKKAQFLVMDELDSVKGFLDKCAETGSWNGRDTEGFVIRCQMRGVASREYFDWFFKYKFEEPYLMYRQWREVTKAAIAGKVPKIKKHKKITEEYLLYARRQLAKDPKIGKLFAQNHGIIAMREGFLKERGLKGSDIIAMEGEDPDSSNAVVNGVVLVPVASIGCGKTTVSHALSKLFGWGHVQNDNLPKQKNKPKRFAQEIILGLAQSPVVIADRNNHQKRERKQIMDDVLQVVGNARFVAFQYVHEPKGILLDEIREITRKRVFDRGDNHQTIRSGSKDMSEIIGIMEGFLSRFEAVNTERVPDDNFEEVIDLDVGASSRENLEIIIQRLHNLYPRIVTRVPSGEEMDEAIEGAVADYHVEQDLSWGSSSKDKKGKSNYGATERKLQKEEAPEPPKLDPDTWAKKIEYFGVSLPNSHIQDLLTSLFPVNTPPDQARLYNHLVKSRRIQPAFHVTLIHRASTKDHPEIWQHYRDRYVEKMRDKTDSGITITPKLSPARIRIERLVWDDKIMTFVVRIMPPAENSTRIGDAGKLEDNGPQSDSWPCANPIPHITIGTASPDVKPKQSNDLLMKWLEVGSGPETGIFEAEVPGVKFVEGFITEVMMRGK